MGRMQREKGKRYERAIAAELRVSYPNADIRRTSQADRAANSDLAITGGPPILSRFWLELNDAAAPNPIAKLQQAEHDVCASTRNKGKDLLPIVIWHRLAERKSHATMRLWVLDAIRGCLSIVTDSVVTMTLEDFLVVVEEWHPNRCTCAYEVGSGGPVCSCWFGKQAQQEAA
jgi:hypothetical protein